MRTTAAQPSRRKPEEIRQAIERFLKACRQPAVLEPGEDPLQLAPGSFVLECRSGRLTLEVWDATRNLVRRIIDFEPQRPGRLELQVERFGKRLGTVRLLDLARAGNEDTGRHGARLVFREQFRHFLLRQFPGWKIEELSTGLDLEHSLSPVYPRALLKKGVSACAAIGAPGEKGSASGVLSFGLIWLDYLRRRERRQAVEGLALFLPCGQATPTCLRLCCLNRRAAQFGVWVYDEAGYEDQVDPADHGNLETHLETSRAGMPGVTVEAEAWVDRLSRLAHVEKIRNSDGSVSLRVRGLEFARLGGAALLFGVDSKQVAQAANIPEIEAIARELARLRSPDARDRSNPLYMRLPESWLESQVRANIELIDAALFPEPIYGQVPAFAGGDRGVLDLLASERSGRLAVLELKATADLHLPVQSLDYWMRVRWHAERDEFRARGYFPGLALSCESPRLLLVAPCLEFHPTTEIMLRYFSPEIEVERIGLGADWQKELKVMFRLRGAQRPV